MQKRLLVCLSGIILILAASALGAAEAEPADRPPQKERCPVCGMFVSMFADWNGEVRFTDSRKAVFDGAKDTFKYYLDMKKYDPSRRKEEIVAVLVKDYYSRESVDAFKAHFVIWSDVYGPMGHEPIPFEKESDARRFLKEHKGKKIVRFKDVTLKLLHALDNP